MVLDTIAKPFVKVFGSRNDRLIKSYRRRAEQVNTFEPKVRKLTDAELKAKTDEFRRRLADGERMSTMLPEVMAVAREAMDRFVGIRNILNPEHAFDASTLPGALLRGPLAA